MAHPLRNEIDKLVQSNPVMIFMKGTPDFPMCGFSAKAVQVLKAAGANKLAGFDVLSDDPMWDALEDYSQWPTVPQIFIGGKFVGGCDIVTEMFERGELQPLVQEAVKA
ncbi:MAG: Grx4 family monothiol glutaredoxin [Bdellovibrionales bacterium]|nr:Grx4 family monothiol glutaredoxin [Bdellovibrionales bacterium]